MRKFIDIKSHSFFQSDYIRVQSVMSSITISTSSSKKKKKQEGKGERENEKKEKEKKRAEEGGKKGRKRKGNSRGRMQRGRRRKGKRWKIGEEEKGWNDFVRKERENGE